MSKYMFPRPCSVCGVPKGANDFYWHEGKHLDKRLRPRATCKACYRVKNAQSRRRTSAKSQKDPIQITDPAALWLTRPIGNTTWENGYAIRVV